MTEQCKVDDRRQGPKSLTDFYHEDRHELVQRLAYEYWEKRGHPFGSPETDWFAAESDLRGYLLATGVALDPGEGLYGRAS